MRGTGRRLAPGPRRVLARVGSWVGAAPGTYLWLLALYGTGLYAASLPAAERTAFLHANSTNLDHLHDEPFRVLVTSAFVADGAELVQWTVIFTLVFAVAERWLGTRRWLAVTALGHVGATLASQAVVLAGVRSGRLPESMRGVVDVGPSYALMATAGVLVYALPGPWRWAWIVPVAAYVGIPLAVDHDFTSVGHAAAVLLGLACRPLARGRPPLVDQSRSRPRLPPLPRRHGA